MINWNDHLVAFGGKDGQNKDLSTIEQYESRTNQWRLLEQQMQTERYWFAGIAIP